MTRSFPLSGYFYPRPPRGGRLIYQATTEDDRKFLSTPSARRATGAANRSATIMLQFLSTPSARRATSPWWSVPLLRPYFYPRPPRGGRRLTALLWSRCCCDFYPRPPRGGRQVAIHASYAISEFLSTPSARRATYQVQSGPACHPISIHALREEGDAGRPAIIVSNNQFLSTPSARRATRNLTSRLTKPNNFYPRPPRGGRRL